MTADNLFGQLSETGKPFDCGYYISSITGSFYFAQGEETERDNFLREKGFFDEETPTWESLCEYNEDSFYYSEWFVSDDMDGGYDENGEYWLFGGEKFIKEN